MTSDGAAFQLSGQKLPDGWEVLNLIDASEVDQTGGAFSVGYIARNAKSGEMGYLKAFDYGSAFDEEDPARTLEMLAATYNAERDLLEHCGRRKLRRVVKALTSGTIRVEGYVPPAVSYLIFELADGDARTALADHDPLDQVPMLKLAHHAAVAMAQLHSIAVAHQDVKPSNLLVWSDDSGASGKLGDLGRAHMEGRPAPHDRETIAGDCSYAAPEQLYRGQDRIPHEYRRYAADVYMLGNLICFLLTGVSYNGFLFMTLDRSQHWARWGDSFDAVLPALVDAHGLTLTRLREVLIAEIRDEGARIIDELCYPDPNRRGDPGARRGSSNPFELKRYVTRLDLIYKRARVLETSAK